MKLCLDTQNFSTKPHIAGAISKRLVGCQVDISIQELAQYVVQPYGRTWCPSYFGVDEKGVYQRKNEYWIGQTVFALDFDGGIAWQLVLERCSTLSLNPAFVYTTFSSVDANKFRVVFQTPFEVQDVRVRNVLQYALMALFPECDKGCKDPARQFYGGKELIHEEYAAFIDIATVVESMCCYIMENDKDRHATRDIRKFCLSTGLDMLNGLPKIESVSVEEKVAQIPRCSNIYSYLRSDCAKKNDDGYVFLYFSDKMSDVKHTLRSVQYEIHEETVDRVYERDYDFSKLEDRCKLYRDFVSGADWFYHHELFGIATNLLSLSGGQKRFLEAITTSDNYCTVVHKWKGGQIPYINKRAYTPQNCDAFCKHADECEHAKNMVETGKLPLGRINIYKNAPFKPIEQAEVELQQTFKHIMSEDNNKVYVIKAPTGLGKTELFLGVQNTTIAVPRHNLKEDIEERIRDAGNFVDSIPERPKNSKFQARMNRYYKIGLKDLASKSFNTSAPNPAIVEYLRKRQQYASGDGTCITTHAKLLIASEVTTTAVKIANPETFLDEMNNLVVDNSVKMRETNNDLIIIDEDILTNLLQVDSMTLQDYNQICQEFNVPDSLVREYSKILANTACGEITFNLGLVLELLRQGSKLAVLMHPEITSNVLDFFKADYWRRQGNIVRYIKRRKLADKKTIIFSATASEEFYRQLFRDRLEFIDLGHVSTKGKIVQYPQMSFSRSSLKGNKMALNLAKVIARDKPVITFKDYEKDFPNCIATFGNLAGLNSFSGQDIVVIGTPHINAMTYWLFAVVLGLMPPAIANEEMRYIPIKRNGMEFYFNTFVHNKILRNVQLQMIEAELLQAIGRARLLRHECTVTVLSNYPIPGAEFKYLTKKEIDELVNNGGSF